MRPGVLLGKISLPSNLPPLAARIMDDWRGMYTSCKTRKLSIHVLEEEHQRLRALADSFYSAFRDDPRVEFDETQYRVLSSVIVHGNEKYIRFPFDLFIHESHAEILPIIADRLRNSSEITDERIFIDRIALEFEQIRIILKKNDVRIIRLLSDTRFIETVGNLFPTETQVARQLGVTEATAEMRIRRLMDVNAMQLRYLAHPSSFGCAVRLVEHPWPLEPKIRKDSLYSFEYVPKRGITCLTIPSNEKIELEDSTIAEPSQLIFTWNLAQLNQWNKQSWDSRTQLTAGRDEEEEMAQTSLEIKLNSHNQTKISREDAEAIDILQKTQGIGSDSLEKHYKVPKEEALKKLNWLIEEKYCTVMPYFLHIGLENKFFVYYEGTKNELAQMRKNLTIFPQAELVSANKKLLGLIYLPKSWSHGFASDAEELRLNGHQIHYRVASRDAIHKPWKMASYLWDRSSS
ncbi:MAG: hypothetical protein ACE5OZ_12255 [Candidatus Heimdallarchaeota archaeon]